jgi:hypothetical protein
VSSDSPIGPKAWIFVVLMPISAPSPSWWPSLKRVEAFTSTRDESTSRRKRIARPWSRVMIASVCRDPCFRMCSIAASIDGTTRTARMRSRYSVPQSDARAGTAAGTRRTVSGQPRIATPAAESALAASGRNADAIPSCTRRVSMALQTPGRCAFAFTQTRTASGTSAPSST